MVTTHQMLGFGLAAFILIAIPGPSVVFAISRALAYGRAVALATVLGNSLGLLVVLVLVSVGLGAIVSKSIVVFTVLKFAGAAYLVWLGVQAIRHRKGISVDGAEVAISMTLPRALRQGFVVGFSNPKAFLIFAALLPQFLDRSEGHLQVQMLLLGLLAFVIGLCSDTVWAITASQLRTWFNASPGRGRKLGAIGGFSMIGLGVAIAATARPD
jgi:threonine/homoserine/homoserine lactone efflux protein